MFARIIIFLIVVVFIVIIGCSKSPDIEFNMATISIDSAIAVEAKLYVPRQLQMVEDSMSAAVAIETEQNNKFSWFRRYGESQKAFIRVDSLAKEVIVYAISKKDSVKKEVSIMLIDTKAIVDSVTLAFNKAPKGKDNKADLELIKNDLLSLASAYTEAEADFNGGKFLDARYKLGAITTMAHNVIGEIKK
jgi:hypothetical protein